jgi:hypothetical protein
MLIPDSASVDVQIESIGRHAFLFIKRLEFLGNGPPRMEKLEHRTVNMVRFPKRRSATPTDERMVAA